MGGFWFVFPLMGFVFMLVMILFMFYFLRGRRGMMCGPGRDQDIHDLRREVRDLKAEIQDLKRTSIGG
jgi:uncharacterized membrane protein